MAEINWLAVIVASISAFALGAVWYAPPVFGNLWMKANKFKKEDVEGANMVKIFGTAFLLTFVMAVTIAVFVAYHVEPHDFRAGLLTGFAGGVWIFLGIGVVALFERRPAAYVFINGGYCLVLMVLIGAIIGCWR